MTRAAAPGATLGVATRRRLAVDVGGHRRPARAGGRRRSRPREPSAGSPDGRPDATSIAVLRHGRQRDRRRRAGGGGGGPRCAGPRVVVVKSYELPAWVGARLARLRRLVLGRHRGDPGRRGGGRRRRGATVVAVTGGRRAGPDWPRTHGAPRGRGAGVDPPAPRPRSARWRCRPSSCSSALGLLPGAVDQLLGAVRRWRRRRDQLVGPREPGPRGGSAHRPDHPVGPRRPRASPRWPRRAGRPRSTRTPRRRPSRPPSPSSATTRSPAGASTATSPGRSSRSSRCAAPASTPRWPGASTWVAEMLREVVADVIEVRAEGDERAGAVLRPRAVRRLRLAPPGRPRGRRPGAGADPGRDRRADASDAAERPARLSARAARRSWPCPGRRRRTSTRGRWSCRCPRAR